VEAALSRIFGGEVKTECAGRTDAGVHALGQVMSVGDVPSADLGKVRDSLNSMCGPSISIASVVEVADGFSARFSARSRTYVYAILTSPVPDPFLAATTWHVRGDLDVAAMNEAAGHLLGEHDFSSFGRVVDPEGSTVRTLFDLRAVPGGPLVKIKARAGSFIQQMVRSLAGTLVHVGQGKIDPDAMPAILESRDRGLAGPVAPPHGLCLVAVEYDEGWSPFDQPK
jgi:tRNA pseudouridine38-40 synthase